MFSVVIWRYETWVLPDLENLKAGCLKAIHHKDDGTNANQQRSNDPAAIPPIEETRTDSDERPKGSGHVEYDCLVAFYTRFLARFTMWLVGATLVLGIGTCIAGFAAFRATTHMLIVERANVSGGGYFPKIGDTEERRNEFSLRVNNYGKTPAYVSHVEIGFWPLGVSSPPVDPRYERCYALSAVVPPGKESLETDVRIPRDEIPGNIIYGRFFYEDMFAGRHWGQGKKRSSGFILRIDESRVVWPVLNPPRAYIDWT